MPKDLLVPVVAGCVIQKDGKYLLVQEKQRKAYGLWNLPAGHVDVGEAFEEAAIRESQEETGFKVRLEGKLKVVHQATDKPVLHAYQANIIGGELQRNTEELLDIKWFTLAEVLRLQEEGKLRNIWVIDSIRQVAEQ